MKSGIVPGPHKAVIDVIDRNTALDKASVAMAEAAESGELAAKSRDALEKAAAVLPEAKTVPTITIDEMKKALRADDCLYTKAKVWKQLGAAELCQVPDGVIEEAYANGGRVILRCSSMREQVNAVRAAGHCVFFWGSAEQSHYTERVSKSEWIVVSSHIDRSTLGRPQSHVVTSDNSAPTLEDWFAVIEYARLDGLRHPKGCENLYAFTNESEALVASFDGGINVSCCDADAPPADNIIGAARLGPPRN